MERIFYNGKILTMTGKDGADEMRNAPEAVLVRDGVIAAVGLMRDIMQKSGGNAPKTDLDGKCLMPSFIDAHSHMLMNGQMSLFADLSGCQSFEEIIGTLNLSLIHISEPTRPY